MDTEGFASGRFGCASGGLLQSGSIFDGKHAFSMIGVREMRQRAYGEGGLEGEGAVRALGS